MRVKRSRRRLAWAGVVVPVMVAMLLTVAAPAASAAGKRTRTPVDPHYVVALTGSADGRTWSGSESIEFRNASTLTLTRIWLRLWSNGLDACHPQDIFVSNVSGGAAGALSRGCTALPVTLTHALAPGATMTLGMDVSIHVPLHRERFGYFDGAALLGTALPTLAIHDGDGWNLDPYADLGESYYSVSGRYDVSLTVPTGLKTPTTGQLQTDTDNGDGTRTRTYAAANVRDFAWAAGDFKEVTGQDASGTTIRVTYISGYVAKSEADASLADAIDAMNTFSNRFGDYPYPEVDVVLSQLSYGMEYPQIVFTFPDRLYVSHELAHQWWYGIVGDDQYDAPWLDETFATWSEVLPDGGVYDCTGPFGWPSSKARITNSMTYWTKHSSEYWVIYEQGACALADAAAHIGVGHFFETLHAYASAHWFGFSTTGDFKAALRKAARKYAPGWDVDAYFKKWRIGPA